MNVWVGRCFACTCPFRSQTEEQQVKVTDIMTTVRQRRVGKGTEEAEDQLSEENNVQPDGKILSGG